MKIAFFEIRSEEKRYLKRHLKGHALSFFEEKLSLDNVDKVKNSKIISVSIYSKVDKKILKKLPNVKLITTRSTGYDHISIKACKKKGINVSNVPSYGSNTVAEHTFALILGLSRKLWTAHSKIQKDDFSLLHHC